MSDALSSFHFIRPGWLLLAPVAVFVWWLWRKHSDPLKGWRQQIEGPLLDALAVGTGPRRYSSANAMLIVWTLGALSIAGPTWKPAPNPFADDSTPLMILLKADAGMTNSVLMPTPLERARFEIADLVSERKGRPLGLIAYAGSAHLVLPPTRDTDVVGQMAKQISPDIMPESGDRLDLALLEAGRFLSQGDAPGSVLVLADSIDTEASALSAAATQTSLPIQVLALAPSSSSETVGLRAAAHRMDATVQSWTVDASDTKAIIRRAARTPVMRAGDDGGRWQEGGFFLLPVMALGFLLSFRREASPEEAAL